MQGSPLSPALYNLTTDHILDKLTKETVASTYVFSLTLGFAGDTVIIGIIGDRP